MSVISWHKNSLLWLFLSFYHRRLFFHCLFLLDLFSDERKQFSYVLVLHRNKTDEQRKGEHKGHAVPLSVGADIKENKTGGVENLL